MLVKVHSQHFDLTPAIKQFALENLREPLEQIWMKEGASLNIELRDLRGGDKQGIDKECRCLFSIPNGPTLVITEVTEDMRKSIHQVRKRLMRRARQHIELKVQGPRKSRKFQVFEGADKGVAGRWPRSQDLLGGREVTR
jgi:ribosome-associated translation inhibitor RaiA